MGQVSGTNQLRRPLKEEMGREQCELWLELQCVIKGIEKTGLARVCAWAPVVSDKGHRKNWVLLGRPVKVKLMNYVFFFLVQVTFKVMNEKKLYFPCFPRRRQ